MRGCSARVWSRERLGRSKPARPAFPSTSPGYSSAVAAATGRWKNFLLGLDFRFLFAYPRRRGGTGLRRGRGTQGASRRRPAPRPETFRRGAFPMAEAHSSLLAKTASANTDVRGTHPKAARDGEANPVPSRPKPWTVPARGLVVFHGPGKTARLSHYFLPRLLLQGKRVLLLDGANSADPRLMARLARERGVPFEQFSRRIQLARAFTCFQLTELIARVPRFTAEFPADVLVVTALPELYYDEDVRDWNARVAFEQGRAVTTSTSADRKSTRLNSSHVRISYS